MRLVTWNLNRATCMSRRRCLSLADHARRAWTALAALLPDVAFLQEACPPPEDLERPPLATLPAGIDREDWRTRPGPGRWWCAAIASWGPLLEPIPALPADDWPPRPPGGRHPLDVSEKGAFRVATTPWKDGRLVLASVYALWDYSWLAEGEMARYAESSLHRSLSDLTPVLDVVRNRLPVAMGGDFNASTQFPPPHRAAYRLVHQRIEAFGLHNASVGGERLEGCLCVDDPCRHLRTLEGPTPYQDDYIYASPDLAARLVPVERTPEMEAVSDHFPVVVDIE